MSRATAARPAPARGRALLCLAAAVVLGVMAADPLRAADPPHWESIATPFDCTSSCHVPHQAAGGGLTQAAGNVALCQSCHNSTQLPITNADKASPGSSGTSHGFDVDAVHAQYGTALPSQSEMSLRVMGGQVVCSTCHDQHATDAAKGGTARIGAAQKVADSGGGGSLASGGTYGGSAGAWYLIEIDGAGSASTATFRWSKDNGTSWMASAVGAGGGAPVALDFGVTVTLTGVAGNAFQLGERWEFYATFPFLRVALDSGDNASADKFCRDCHADWVMTHEGAGGTHDWTGTFKSHPVGVALGAAYDRSDPLDGDGTSQAGAGDGNRTNDLRLDAGGRVQCTTCHGVHYADSVTKTVDEYAP